MLYSLSTGSNIKQPNGYPNVQNLDSLVRQFLISRSPEYKEEDSILKQWRLLT
jgi:hypothetical protein